MTAMPPPPSAIRPSPESPAIAETEAGRDHPVSQPPKAAAGEAVPLIHVAVAEAERGHQAPHKGWPNSRDRCGEIGRSRNCFSLGKRTLSFFFFMAHPERRPSPIAHQGLSLTSYLLRTSYADFEGCRDQTTLATQNAPAFDALGGV